MSDEGNKTGRRTWPEQREWLAREYYTRVNVELEDILDMAKCYFDYDLQNESRSAPGLAYDDGFKDGYENGLQKVRALPPGSSGFRLSEARKRIDELETELYRAIAEAEKSERCGLLIEYDLRESHKRIAKLEADLCQRGEEFQALLERHNSKKERVDLICAKAEQADKDRAKAEAEVANLKAERQEWILVRDVLQANLDRKLACIQGLSSELEQMRQTRKAASKLHWAKEAEQHQKGYEKGLTDGDNWQRGFVDATDTLKSRVRSNVERLFEEEKL